MRGWLYLSLLCRGPEQSQELSSCIPLPNNKRCDRSACHCTKVQSRKFVRFFRVSFCSSNEDDGTQTSRKLWWSVIFANNSNKRSQRKTFSLASCVMLKCRVDMRRFENVAARSLWENSRKWEKKSCEPSIGLNCVLPASNLSSSFSSTQHLFFSNTITHLKMEKRHWTTSSFH